MKIFLKICITAITLLFVLTPISSTTADQQLQVTELNVDEALKGWKLEIKTGEPAYSVYKENNRNAIGLKSNKTSFGFYKEFKVDLAQYPYINWSWKVDKLPEGGDFRKKKTDDQAAQIYIGFPVGWPKKLNTNLVGYLWDNLPDKGTFGPSPSWGKIKLIVLRNNTDKLGVWMSEKRNLYQDYKNLFNAEPPKAAGVGIYINSQHTQSEAQSSFSDIYFSKE